MVVCILPRWPRRSGCGGGMPRLMRCLLLHGASTHLLNDCSDGSIYSPNELRFLFATILSVYNKWMFSADHFGFPAPLFVTTMHMFVQFILAAVLRATWPNSFRPVNRPTRGDYAYVPNRRSPGCGLLWLKHVPFSLSTERKLSLQLSPPV